MFSELSTSEREFMANQIRRYVRDIAAIPMTVNPRPFSDNVMAVVVSFVLLNCVGWAYLRTGTMTYPELEQRNKEIQQEQHQWLTPGYYGTWTI